MDRPSARARLCAALIVHVVVFFAPARGAVLLVGLRVVLLVAGIPVLFRRGVRSGPAHGSYSGLRSTNTIKTWTRDLQKTYPIPRSSIGLAAPLLTGWDGTAVGHYWTSIGVQV